MKPKTKTNEEKTAAQLRNQEVLHKLLAEFTQLGVVVDLKMHHMVKFHGLYAFYFHLYADDFTRLYEGKEVIEESNRQLTREVFREEDLVVYAFCSVEKPQQFDSRKITLTTNYNQSRRITKEV